MKTNAELLLMIQQIYDDVEHSQMDKAVARLAGLEAESFALGVESANNEEEETRTQYDRHP